MSDETRKCHRCGIEKSNNDFYLYDKCIIKSICKSCENTNPSKYKLWYCEDCDITIRKRCKTKHLNSNIHLYCYFHGVKYNLEYLRKQNKIKF